jgi:hypothetical protein
MNNNNPRNYDTVHFQEYLDNGNRDVTFLNNTLQKTSNTKEDLVDLNNNFTITPISTPVEIQQLAGDCSHRKWFISGMSRVCEKLLGVEVTAASFPGGLYRRSFRLFLSDGRSVIASRREAPGRAILEERVLYHLTRHDALVPKPLGFNGVVLIQEDLPGKRLSEVLGSASERQFEQYLGEGLNSLADIHQKAELAGLDNAVPMQGEYSDWLISLLDRTAVIGSFLNVPCPEMPVDALYDLLVLLNPRFLKWDARPGNAMLLDNGQVAWFDWEHCCARNRLDDMAWLLCDESVPDTYPQAEQRIIDKYLVKFADGRDIAEAHDYLRVYGILHMCVRLGRILNAKSYDAWSDADINLEKQLPGSSLKEAHRLCIRAARWSEKTKHTEILTDWFKQLSKRLNEI